MSRILAVKLNLSGKIVTLWRYNTSFELNPADIKPIIENTVKRIAGVFLLLFLAVWCVSSADIEATADHYKELSELDMPALLKKGTELANNGHTEEALVYFSIAAGNSRGGRDNDCLVAKANMNMWQLLFFVYFDYAKAMEALKNAELHALANDCPKARIYLGYGCMYQAMSEQCGDKELERKALDFYKEALDHARKEENAEVADMAYCNFLNMSFRHKEMDDLERINSIYVGMRGRSDDVVVGYNALLWNALKSVRRKDFATAIDAFDQQVATLRNDDNHLRYMLASMLLKSEVLNHSMGNRDAALQVLHDIEEIVEQKDLKDGKMETYAALLELYADMNLSDRKEVYRDKYLSVKDSILNYNQIARIGELSAMGKIKHIEYELRSMERRKEQQSLVILIAVVVIAVTLVFLCVLAGRNRKLRNLNETLFHKNNELIKSEEYRIARILDDHDKCDIAEEKSDGVEKYQRSVLSDHEKESIMTKIIEVICQSREIFDPDFKLARLAELTGVGYRHLSQVINEKGGKNFNAFINEYRVKEACRIISSGNGKIDITIEAIARSVGFKSNTSFISAFKTYTGLTPSKYIRIASK